jgi:hypothetical protein
MARYRLDEVRSGDVSQPVSLDKIGFSPVERGKLDRQPIVGKQTP